MLTRLLRGGFHALPAALLCLYACGRSTDNADENAGEDFGASGREAGVTSGGKAGSSGGARAPGGFGGFTVGGSGCFEAGSLVATPHGSVPIEQLELGDWVLAFDEQSGAVAARRVSATFVHELEASGTLALADGRVLRVTAEHPIFDAKLGAYVRADSFDGDETLVTLNQSLTPSTRTGESLAPELASPSIGLAQTAERGFVSQSRGSSVTVFNISVEGLENYFVEGVLVHNKSGSGPSCPLTPPLLATSDCPTQSACIHPVTAEVDNVELNEPVTVGAGGAGGTDGADSGGAPADGGAGSVSGVAGDGSSIPTYPPTSVSICLDLPPLERAPLLAVDYRMPNAGEGVPGFAIYAGENACSGPQIGEIWVDDQVPPPAGSVTTQCTYLPIGVLPRTISVHSLHPHGEVTNVRFVTSCDCPRLLKYWTTCGLNGASMCLPL